LEEAINQGISRMDAYALFAIVIIYMVGKFALHFIQVKKQSPSEDTLKSLAASNKRLAKSNEAIVTLAEKLNSKGDRILGEVGRVEKKVGEVDKKVVVTKDISLESKMNTEEIKRSINALSTAAITGRNFM
jgi:hypothetical protein